MKITKENLLGILQIGHVTSIRSSEGLSLRDAMSRARYSELRPYFDSADLLPHPREHPDLLKQWILYSEDKRTSGGWWVTETGEVGRLGDPNTTKFETLDQAVAAYVIRELDYWAQVAV
jgi:hypothetical protein